MIILMILQICYGEGEQDKTYFYGLGFIRTYKFEKRIHKNSTDIFMLVIIYLEFDK